MLAFKKKGAIVFDYGNNIRQAAKDEGLADAFDFRDSFPPTSGLYFVKEKGRSAGLRCRETLKIYTARTLY